MDRIEHTILKRVIPDVFLHSENGQYWFDFTQQWVPWVSGSNRIPGMTPDTGSIVHDVRWFSNITYDKDDVLFYSGNTYLSLQDTNINHIPTEVSSSYWEPILQREVTNTKGKYFQWNGSSWELYSGSLGYDYNLPLFLECDAKELGVMVSFDGYMEQVDQLCNFSYTQTGHTIQLYNTVNPDKLRKIVEQTYTINWGDGNSSGFTVNSGIVGTALPTISHTYTGTTGYTISVTLDSPWTKQRVVKEISTKDVFTGHTSYTGHTFGTFSGFTIPYTEEVGSIDYLNDYDYTNNTGYTTTGFTYMSIGKSRVNELKKYGTNTFTQTLTSGSADDGSIWTGYTIDDLYYRDFVDGYTMITGTTSGSTREEVFNNVITRNEHFLGFIDDPTVYSDIFVERGKQGVMENNLRLGEMDSVAELEVYGNGFFNIKKQ